MANINSKNGNHLVNLIRLSLSLGLLSAAFTINAGSLYKWVDEGGNVRYSDQVPPSQIKKQRQKLNARGMVVSTTDAAKTPRQLAVEAEAKRQAKLKKEKQDRIKAAQLKKDRVLLLTFSSEKELEQVKNDRLEVVESVVRLISNSITSTQLKLQDLTTKAEDRFTSNGKEVPGGMAQKIEHFTRKVANRNAQLKLKQTERDKIANQFAIDLKRFRFLKAPVLKTTKAPAAKP